MIETSVILVRPKYPGNIGAVARGMSNFGVERLILVEPIPVDQEARNRAKHANYILDGAVITDTLEEALEYSDINIGTTGIVNRRETGHIRNPLTPDQLFERMEGRDVKAGLVFGREDTGLLDSELMRMDSLMSIPTNRKYPVMNLSHAVCVVLWEFFRRDNVPGRFIGSLKDTSAFEREKLVETFTDLMDAIGYPPRRRDSTEILFRRMVGRSIPTRWEFHTLMGVLGGAVRRLRSPVDERSNEE